jgi:hemerythrin
MLKACPEQLLEASMRQPISTPEASSNLKVISMLHQDLDYALKSAAQADEIEFNERFRKLIEKLEITFSTEEAWMEKIDFPALKTYREQHARVLGGLHHAHAAAIAGRSDTGRKAVRKLLPLWLPWHMAIMDNELAIYLGVSSLPQTGWPELMTASGRREFWQ